MRRVVFIAALSLLAGCGNDSIQPPAPPVPADIPVPPPTSTSAPTSLPPETATSSTGSQPSNGSTTTPSADAAPDFSLPLGTGGTFVLSEEARPVFMVFWAEW